MERLNAVAEIYAYFETCAAALRYDTDVEVCFGRDETLLLPSTRAEGQILLCTYRGSGFISIDSCSVENVQRA